MKSIKIIGFFIVTAALLSAIFVGCEKHEDSQNINEFTEQEIQFGITPIYSDNLKSGHELPHCTEAVPDHAEIKVEIDGVSYTFTPDVFEIDGQWYTEVFKLKIPGQVQDVTVTQFFIMDDEGNKIQATPKDGTPFAPFVEKPLDFEFPVTGIEKIEVEIEVLCYNEKYYAEFGFYWFAFDRKAINKLYFFGDLCTKYFQDYVDEDGEGYHNLDSKFDLPAIFKVEVWDETEDNKFIEYDNMYMLPNINEPLAVYYPNDLEVTGDTYTLKLYIRLKDGNGYSWVEYQTIYVDGDTGNLTFPGGTPVPDYGNDSVVDFVIGECAYYDAENPEMQPDIEFAPYMNLPNTANITISYPGDNAYWEVVVNSVSPLSGYDFDEGTYKGWCADAGTTINEGDRTYEIHSSLYPSLWPECAESPVIDATVINQINHLYNYLQNKNIDYSWQAFQVAVWNLRGQTNYPDSQQSWSFSNYQTEANNLYDPPTLDENYMPLPGGYAAVLLHKACSMQLIFVQVDP